MSCICSSLLLCVVGGPGGIVVLVCVPRSVLSTWQFSASRQGGKSILSDLWRYPRCNNNTAQCRAWLRHLTHPQLLPQGSRPGASSTLILTPPYCTKALWFTLLHLSSLYFFYLELPPTVLYIRFPVFYTVRCMFQLHLRTNCDFCICCYLCLEEGWVPLCKECDLRRDQTVDLKRPQRSC